MTAHENITNGIIGAASSSLAIISTFQEQFEWWVRITGGLLLIGVSAVTLFRALCKKNK
jgi:hypothetical protein